MTTILRTRTRSVERAAYQVGALLFLSGVVHLVVLIASGTTWEGPLSYRKAMTFGLSFGLTLATLAWATSFLRMNERVRTALLGAFTVVSVVEVALVTMQVWRGVPSHFDFETGFDTVVSMMLAIGAVIIVTVLGFTLAALRSTSGLSPSMLLALRFGLVVLIAALAVGAVMIVDGVRLARGGEPQLAYTTAGALKPVHFVAMHAILVVPALAWLMRFTDWTERRRTRIIQAIAVIYAIAVAGTWLVFG
ncbi:hypothetical protein [Amycolatopsis alkalitolerans]|uniref:Uncharacterized protein n=1 Tax=Amycolatopsis alkalitolerans TaxID=2547244 RepID=A0A5C4M5X6_9PSEU|nr:hypothetical protein [Amycolatopsis alkalitolerans]TNC28532.1 hypothetical protein FG385_04460 [Amycolatopsis alkalitolerans]